MMLVSSVIMAAHGELPCGRGGHWRGKAGALVYICGCVHMVTLLAGP